jgi:hypothetical protein
MLGAGLTLVGAWLRMLCAVTDSFPIVSLGSVIAAFGQIFFINTSSKLATTWFGDKEVSNFKFLYKIERCSDSFWRPSHPYWLYYWFCSASNNY